MWFFTGKLFYLSLPSPRPYTAHAQGNSQPFPLAQAYLTYATSVALGAQTGMEECKFQFAWERWNCPEHAVQFSTHNRLRGGKFSRGPTARRAYTHGSMACVCMMERESDRGC